MSKETSEDHLLDDLAPKLKREKRKHKYQSTKGLPVDVAVRRQAAAEASAENPLPRLQKDAILMKYGVNHAVIEREIQMPGWKAAVIFQHSERPVEVVWNSMMQDWIKSTRGMVIPSRSQQRTPVSGRGYTKNPHSPTTRPSLPHTWATIRFKDPVMQAKHEAKYQGPRNPNSRRSSVPMDRSTNSRPN